MLTAENATKGLSPDTITRRVLSNGLIVLAFPKLNTPALLARLSIKGGAMYDPPEKAGLASFASRSMRRGTTQHTFDQLNEDTEGRGASVGVDSGQTLLEVSGRALKEDTGFLLETIAEVALQPTFPPSEIDKLRTQIRTGLLEMEQDTGSVADRFFRQTLYPEGHPYHYRTSGYLETIDNITRDDMLEFYARSFRPERAILTVVGDIDPEDIVRRANDLLGSWKAAGEDPGPYEIEDVPRPAGATNVFHYVAGKTQNDLILGLPSLRRRNPDYYAFDLMNLLLGRIGLMGRLGKTVRDKQGLAYYAGSSFEAGLGAGPWAVRAGVNPENVQKAIDSIRHEIERIRTEPIPQEELQGGIRFMTGVLPLRLETSDGLARSILEMELYDLGFDYISRFPEIIRGLTTDQVQRVAHEYLSANDYVASIAGPPVELAEGNV